LQPLLAIKHAAGGTAAEIEPVIITQRGELMAPPPSHCNKSGRVNVKADLPSESINLSGLFQTY